MKKYRVSLYDQSLEYFTRNGCTVYTLVGILSDMWNLKFSNDQIISALKEAEEDKKWYQSWGAYFSKIYIWFCLYFYELEGLQFRVHAVNINSDAFEKMCKEGYSFGLGLKKSGKAYRKAIADGNLTKKEIDTIFKAKSGYGHNHRYYRGHIIENYREKLDDNTIEMPLPVLRYAVKIGLYYPTARTLIEASEFTRDVGGMFRGLMDGGDEDVTPNNEYEEEVVNKFSSINMRYKHKNTKRRKKK